MTRRDVFIFVEYLINCIKSCPYSNIIGVYWEPYKIAKDKAELSSIILYCEQHLYKTE